MTKFENRTNKTVSFETGLNTKRFTQWTVVEPRDIIDTDDLREKFEADGITVYNDIDKRAASVGLNELPNGFDMDSRELQNHTIQELRDIAEDEGIKVTVRKKTDIVKEIIRAREEDEE